MIGNVGLISKIYEPNVEFYKDQDSTEPICTGFILDVDFYDEDLMNDIGEFDKNKRTDKIRIEINTTYSVYYFDKVLILNSNEGVEWTFYTEFVEELYYTFINYKFIDVNKDISPEHFYIFFG